jgi:hypothetical protein
LNKHLNKLGLAACFHQTVISKRGNDVSHVTLNYKWNNLPRTESETLEWWLGEGPQRVTLASPLDPLLHDQRPIPIFWAAASQGKNKSGGDRCHYVGHFRCIRFNKVKTASVKRKLRQALIEFEFVEFDKGLSQAMTSIRKIG